MGGRSRHDETRLHCMRRAIPEHQTSFEFAETCHCTKIIRVSIKGSEQRVWDATAPGRITCERGKHGRLTGRPSQRSALYFARDGSIRISRACGQGPDALARAEVGYGGGGPETRTCMGKPAVRGCDSCPFTAPRRDYNRSKIFEALDRVRAIRMEKCVSRRGWHSQEDRHECSPIRLAPRRFEGARRWCWSPSSRVPWAWWSKPARCASTAWRCARGRGVTREGVTRPRSLPCSFCPIFTLYSYCPILTPPFSPFLI